MGPGESHLTSAHPCSAAACASTFLVVALGSVYSIIRSLSFYLLGPLTLILSILGSA